MPVIARFCGIVIRLLHLRSLGTRLHAFHGNSEMVIDLRSLRIIEGNVSERVSKMVMAWARAHQRELLAGHWSVAEEWFVSPAQRRVSARATERPDCTTMEG